MILQAALDAERNIGAPPGTALDMPTDTAESEDDRR